MERSGRGLLCGELDHGLSNWGSRTRITLYWYATLHNIEYKKKRTKIAKTEENIRHIYLPTCSIAGNVMYLP